MLWLRRERMGGADAPPEPRALSDEEVATLARSVETHSSLGGGGDDGGGDGGGDGDGGGGGERGDGAAAVSFVSVAMHSLTLRQQAALVADCSVLGGLEGAAFVNQLFMPTGGSLLLVQIDGGRDGGGRDGVGSGALGWQWGYGQYLRRMALWLRAPPSARDVLVATAGHALALLATRGAALERACGAPPDGAAAACRRALRPLRGAQLHLEVAVANHSVVSVF